MGLTQDGLFPIGEVLDRFPAILVCAEGDCGSWRTCYARAEADAFMSEHGEKCHGGRAEFECWEQRPDSPATALESDQERAKK